MLVAILSAKDTEQRIFNHHCSDQFHICYSDQEEKVDAQARVVIVQSLGLTIVLYNVENQSRDRGRKWSLESKVEHSRSPALESGGSELFEQITRMKVKDMNICT